MIGPGGEAPMALAVLWALTALTLCFVVLRLWTRLGVLSAYGIDDHFFNFAFVLFLAYDVMLTVAAFYGFGRDIGELQTPYDVSHAILYEAIGVTILVVGTVVSKTSLALFLLRLVTSRLHQVVILVPVVVLGLFVVVSLLVFWLSCTPVEYLWNRFIPDGTCRIDPGPISTAAGSWSVVVDFWYAVTPWALLWNVQMPKREKLLINVSMSLGVIAGACGIQRAVELKNLSSPNFTKDTVGLIVWHAAELAVTMVCIGIPVCRPLFKGWLNKFTSRNGSKPTGPYTRDMTGSNGNFLMRTIGGTDYTVRVGLKTPELDLGGRAGERSGYETSATERSAGKGFGDDASVESILGPELRQGQSRDDGVQEWPSVGDNKANGQNIWVKSEVVVKSTARS
ncbi:Satratoxin biosynthesis SC1 cluster protein 4 [Colletotrichum spinosum]|uniref:Satratoxin biosynthesis SC1 cluster protein 4 n=1 Tax=Colletotrichum spinosum TaxID=1347390 RepID=A0A4R8PYK1_9PEZI|nr:Satratoxin biosynthesis SC1 cluster protein 4 [Colletotrichum spinosum]